jgi:uncharacterized protein YbbC (DUF1343 family)
MFLIGMWMAPTTAHSDTRLPVVSPHDADMDASHLNRIDQVVSAGLARKQMPGCVVCIGRKGQIVFRRAYGFRQLKPEKISMTVDTVFDMASITKPVATATSVMQLIERGQLRLRDTVAKHIPEFGQNGKSKVTVSDLLLHQGGLIPDNGLADYNDGPTVAMEKIFALPLIAEPGSKFIYTDVGYIVLAELVRRKTGKTIHEFTQENLFGPLGMTETGYLPRADLRARAAPTEQRDARWMQGEVHDPRAYRLDGIAGHAGLFSTADDLAVYANMMLGRGAFGGKTILGPHTVEMMTRPYSVSSGLRGLGWDKQTGYSLNRGEQFSSRAFGHGGFTGTTLWMDPTLDLFVIFLSNRLHPNGRGSVNHLAGTIGTIAAGAIRLPAKNELPERHGETTDGATNSGPGGDKIVRAEVLAGIDVLQRDGFKPLKGRVGLIANHTSLDRNHISTVEVLHDARQVDLVALFSPEHGFKGTLDQRVIGDADDQTTGLTIHSLYGATRQPTAKMLAGVDTLVFDIQDIGTRFYTYVSTMGESMKAAASHGVRFVVLDRPNPINGVDVAGPVLDPGRESFVGWHTLPVRHGMTVGELARMFNEELELGLDLHVVPIEGWERSDYFDAVGLTWINPSPNMRSLTEALLYPGIGLLETTNLSVGRGTDTPFEVVGAPWIDGRQLAMELNRAGLPGVRFVPIRFTPNASKFTAELCGGINTIVVDRKRFRPLSTGLEIALQLRRLYPDKWKVEEYARLLGNAGTLNAVMTLQSRREIEAGYQVELQTFLARRARFLIYR